MTIRPTHTRMPEHFLPLTDANRRAVRAFIRGAVMGSVVGFFMMFSVFATSWYMQ